jgi:serine/threonine protein kinase
MGVTNPHFPLQLCKRARSDCMAEIAMTALSSRAEFAFATGLNVGLRVAQRQSRFSKMTPATFPLDRADTPLFADGLGERVLAADATTGELLQVLRLRPELTAVPSFEFALRERTARLTNFRHAYYARVRRVDRLTGGGGLAIVSDHVEGTRLSDVLRVAHQRGLQLDTNAALCLIRQLVPAVSLLHENARDASHGLIAPERLVVTPHARLVIVEHVLGSGVEQLQFSRDRLWQEFRVAIPSSAGMARFDHRADVNGIGITALSLVLGRPLGAEEVPHAVPQLLMQARERTAMGEERPLSNAFRNWLGRTLQLDVRRAFASAPEALAALEETLATDASYIAAPVALENFLAQYHAVLSAPAPLPLSIVPPPVSPPAIRSAAMPVVGEPAAFSMTPPPMAAPFAASPAGSAPAVSAPIARPPAASAPLAPVPPPVPVAPSAPPPISFAPVPVGTARAFDTPPSFVPPSVARPPSPPPSDSVPTLGELISLEDLTPQTPAGKAFLEPPVSLEQPVSEAVRQRSGDSPASFDHDTIDFDALSPFSSLDDSLADTPPAGSFEPDPAPLPVPAPRPVMAGARGRARVKVIAAVAAGAAVIAGGVYASRAYSGGAVPELGTLNVQSSPAGVEVFVDGVSRGMTPARVSVAAGSHILELRGRGVPRVIPLQVPAGGQVSQYLEFADTPTTGMLVVHSQPQGANVTVDGTPRGVAPITIEGLSSGDHDVVLQSAAGTSRHTVKVLAGTTASLVAPIITTAPVAEGPVSGWISVKAPFVIEIHEDGRLIGTTETDRLMLASGRHSLEFVNSSLGYRQTQAVQVLPGKVASVSVDLPQGSVNLNAAPWAEVWIDGRRVGETPIGNLAVPIGPHEIVFRHPEFGEKKQAVSVTTGAPVRLSVSMK